MNETIVLGGGLLRDASSPLEWYAGVAIEDGTVREIGPNNTLVMRYPGAERIEAYDLILAPGFVNGHMHAYGLLAHGIPLDDAPGGFDRFLSEFWWPRVEDRLDQEMIAAATAQACAELIRSGVTAFCDVLEAPYIAGEALTVEAEVVERAGLRAVLCIEASERLGEEVGRRALQENVRFVEATASHPRIGGMQCIHTSFSCSEAFVRDAKRSADRLGCAMHLHLSESDDEPRKAVDRYGVRPVAWYDRIGCLDSSLLASQAVAVDGAEIELLARRGVRIVHMPLSNCEVGGGIAPVPRMIDCGIEPGLGSDGYLNDPFEVMRGAFLIHKANCRDSSVMPARTVWSMATAWSAAAIGLPQLGALRPGSPADLIGIDAATDTPLNEKNVFDQLLLYRSAEHVRLSIVGGRVLMRDRELQTLDQARTRRAAAEQALRLWGESDD